MKLPTIGGRECVPVRLVPFLTRRQMLSPDHMAQIFSWRHPFNQVRRWGKDTYQLLPDGTFSALQPRDWDDTTDKLALLETTLRRQEKFDGELAAEWDRQSVELLPAGVFVWRDELESEYARLFSEQDFFVVRPGLPDLTDEEYEAALNNAIESSSFDALTETATARLMTRPGDGELSFNPLVPAAMRQQVFEGFETLLGVVDADKAGAGQTGCATRNDLVTSELSTGAITKAAASQDAGFQAEPVPSRPTQRRPAPDAAIRTHRVARDLLAPLIDRVCKAIADPNDSAAVMAELERLGRLPEKDRPAPLAGVNSGAVQWRNGGTVKNLTRKALGDRIKRRAKAR